VSTNAYDGGRFSFRFEEPVHRFQTMVVQMMAGGDHKYEMPPGDADTNDIEMRGM
jgi:choline monooxygenase